MSTRSERSPLAERAFECGMSESYSRVQLIPAVRRVKATRDAGFELSGN